MNLSQHKSTKVSIFILLLLIIAMAGVVYVKRETLIPLFMHKMHNPAIKLPAPVFRSNTSIEEAIKLRRSTREYKPDALTLPQVAQLLWAAQGITSAPGFRTAPSAGGIYPLEIYLVAGNVQNLAPGVYHYSPTDQSLELVTDGDKRQDVSSAVHKNNSSKEGAIDIIITASYKKTTAKYGNLGQRFVYMEAGHVAENIYLQCVSLGLGTVSIGSFDDGALKRLIGIPREEDPIYVMPVGKL